MSRILVQSSLCHMALSHKWIIRLPPSHTAALHRLNHTHERSFQHKPRLLWVCVFALCMCKHNDRKTNAGCINQKSPPTWRNFNGKKKKRILKEQQFLAWTADSNRLADWYTGEKRLRIRNLPIAKYYLEGWRVQNKGRKEIWRIYLI